MTSFSIKINDQYDLKCLTKQLAQKHLAKLTDLANQIPLVHYTPELIISDAKPDGSRIYYGKWEHSLILFDGPEPIGFIMGYERKSENNQQYPQNTIHISELAVDPTYAGQKLGIQLVEQLLKHSTTIGMHILTGKLNFSVQTNADIQINAYVIHLYQSLGFKPRCNKHYDNRTDIIMGLTNNG